MITSHQTRAARALLGWTQEMLADRAKVSLTALKRMESANGLRVYESTADQVRRAFEAAGVVFINSSLHIGVMVDESRRENRQQGVSWKISVVAEAMRGILPFTDHSFAILYHWFNHSASWTGEGLMTSISFLDEAPTGDLLTDYDRRNVKLYVRLLDAEADGAQWEDAVEVIFGIDPVMQPERARKVHDSHLARAHWMTEHGYKILRRGRPN